ncbi:hypothetical protein KIN20_004015 [Parelaphostrongylus tenuis]|uniref:Uncharacterized protein n=1 Tax=Parelaphostrongylus tenuis TaxID=148309 RepID=A0AAD5M2F0_PARTN|nr:hypothetical protein KIN20_004015 [Parelaphostrongylus tenuis]
MISLFAAISTVFGCGVMPAGQGPSLSTGFTLPVAMVYTDNPTSSAQARGIATSRGGAEAFVSRLVMQTVFDVLESQARGALLPDVVTTAILSQLSVNASYDPMLCQKVAINLMDGMAAGAGQATPVSYCIIIGSTVTGICTKTDAAAMKCMTSENTVDKNACSRQTLDNLRHSHGLNDSFFIQLRFSKKFVQTTNIIMGELVENDVAKCNEWSCSNACIRSI